MVATREKLHALIDALPEPELHTAQRFLEYLRWESDDSLASLLRSAPIDDEPVTDEEAAAVAEAVEQYRRGETLTLEEVKRYLAS